MFYSEINSGQCQIYILHDRSEMIEILMVNMQEVNNSRFVEHVYAYAN